MATIYDVAKEAGVSHTTVSRVLNRKKVGIPVSDETKKRVMAAAAHLNYTPNRAAKNLSTGRTNCFCFLLCDRLFTNLYYYNQLKFIEKELSKRGLSLLFAIYKSDEEFPNMLRERAADGIFVTGRVTREVIAKLQKLNIPFVLLGKMSDQECEVNLVQSDVSTEIMTVYNYLLENGHREITYVTDFKESLLIREITTGCELAYQQYSQEPRMKLIKTNVNEPYVAIKEVFDKHPEITAFVIQSHFAAAFTHIAEEQGLDIPGDISVVFYGDEGLNTWQKRYFTYMPGGAQTIGKEAVRNLIQRSYSQESRERIHITIPGRIIDGKSVKKL